ncbi:MAG TPA: hypothetical protein VEM93_04785 [Actinomycetota bacterium]|nr:hypothetical protein [Actinomycetota bacterium]
MRRIRIRRRSARRVPGGGQILSLDPRDPDVVRAKTGKQGRDGRSGPNGR